MLEHKVLYTSDVHGDMHQLNAFAEYAAMIKPDTIIIAGEIAPKHYNLESSGLYIKGQAEFLSRVFPQMMERLKRRLPDTRIFVSMGNDDAAANIGLLRGCPNLYTELHGNRVKLNNDFDIVGYSYCPITPFSIKDWEKFDLTAITVDVETEYERRKEENYVLNGQISKKPHKWIDYIFDAADEYVDSIQLDLMRDVYAQDANRTIYVMHAPPNNTVLDVLRDKKHVGSFAIREFIENRKPYAALHGHIHETVEMSNGRFMERIGNSISMSAGNNIQTSYLSVLVFNAYDPASATRVRLPARGLPKLFSRIKKGLKNFI